MVSFKSLRSNAFNLTKLSQKNTFYWKEKLASQSWGHKIFMTQPQCNITLTENFFKPLVELYKLSDFQRDCPELSDLEYLQMGVERCISSATSGNGFLQTYRKADGSKVGVSHFFESLKSKRRLNQQKSINHLMRPYLKDHMLDELSSVEEFKKWHFVAGDGHYQKAAIFDSKPKADNSEKEPSKSPTGHFFGLDLRTHHLGYLDLAQPDDGKKSEHDMKMLKRQELTKLRDRATKGTKVLWLWDRAVIDYDFWLTAKSQKGIYFATMEKSNSVTKFIREHTIIDYEDKRNEGVISDRMVETSQGFEVRQVIYINPADGVEYRYLTNELTLPAWAIVLLYKHRWDIEKVFDQLKSKLGEQRSWASSKDAKQAHALFLCLTHNLMLLLERALHTQEGMSDSIEPKKKKTRAKTKRNGWRKNLPPSFINSFFKRATQRTVRFIRWLRFCLSKRLAYRESLAELADVW